MTASLRVQLNSFFKHCPEGDYLTAEDAAEKCRADLAYAYRTLKAMTSEGVLETIRVQSTRRNCMVVAYRALEREAE
jgi:Fe2+ or Zn2+ uptake regulation protein